MENQIIVHYQLFGDQTNIQERAYDICLEQTVELPDKLLTDEIRSKIVGKILSIETKTEYSQVRIGFSTDVATYELTQLLNVLFGNISIKVGIKITDVEFPQEYLSHFSGPKFGISGIRKQAKLTDSPLLCTALKPMGTSNLQLAEYAHNFAMGGIHYIKDDHGLSNQRFNEYKERVELCSKAVARANSKTGQLTFYVPNITSPSDQVLMRAEFAQKNGAGGFLICPGLVGMDTMRLISERFDLPIFSHPAMLGTFVTSKENGFSHSLIFGKLQRLAGADASIFPNYGGRFGFSKEECISICKGCTDNLSNIKSIFPVPAGGMTLDKIPEMIDTFGKETIFLVGGGLYSHSSDLTENAKYFSQFLMKS